jgi:type II secretory pathway component GspD/PulD (secretin)
MTRFVKALAVCALLLAATAGRAEDNKRLLYAVRNGPAKDVAAALNKLFKGDLDVEAVGEPSANCLLISGKPAAVAEAVKALELLDRRTRLVAVEVTLLDLAADKEVDDKGLTGPAADVTAKIADMQKRGQVAAVTRLQLTAAENHASEARHGESKPMVVGVTRRGDGVASRSITYRNTGTQVSLTPRLGQDGTVYLDLNVESARLHTPADGVMIGQDEKGEALRAAEVLLAKVSAKVAVAPGQVVAVEGMQSSSKSSPFRTVVLVTAHALDEGKTGK